MVKNNKFKRSLKYFGILGVINLLYLNLFLPLKLSFEQIFLILIEVVRVCDERGLDISKLSAFQLDEILSLSLNSVKKTFEENGFRFIPNFIKPAYAGGEIVPLGSFSKTESMFIGKVNPYGSAVRNIIQGNTLIGNVHDCIDRLTIVCKNFASELPNSGKFYLASKGIFLMLNITNVQYTVLRYIIWGGSTLIQIFCFPGQLQTKLPMIISSLIRDCHLQVFEIVGPTLAPLLSWTKSLIGIFYKLPFIGNDWYIPLNKVLNWAIITLANTRNNVKSIPLLGETYNFLEAAFHVKIVVLLTRFGVQFKTLSSDSRGLIKFALATYYTESKKSPVELMLDGPYEKYPLSNLPVVYKATGAIAKALGRSEVNISLLVARTGVWLKEFNELDKVLEPMPIPERRRFERLVSRKWMRGEDMTLGSKIITLFQKLAGRFITRGQV